MADGLPFGQGMNGLASFYAGQQIAQNREREQANLATIMQQQERERQMLPLDLETKRAAIAEQNARLPGLEGMSMQQQAAGKLAQGTLSDAIAAKMAGFKADASDAQVKILDNTAQKLQKAAIAVKQAGVPTMMVPEAMRKTLAEYGLDESNPFVQGILKVPPEQMVAIADQIGTGIAKASPANIQNTAQQAQAQANARAINTESRLSQEKIAAGNNATQLEIARMNNQGRLQAAQARQALQRPMSTDQTIAHLSMIPESERTPEEQAALVNLSKQRLAERAAGANALPAQVMGVSTPQQNAQGATPFSQPQAAPPITPQTLPNGMRMIGTSKGKPVYENAQGQRFIGD